MKNINAHHQDFFKQVYQVVSLIPKGRVTSYGAIAKCLGTGSSARMVGWAMNHAHTYDATLPAHRVVNRNGLLTGKYHFATPTTMQHLLEEEGVIIKQDKVIHFSSIFWNPQTEIN